METTNNSNTASNIVNDKLKTIFLLLFTIHFLLNFLGLSVLKYFYLIEVLLFLVILFKLRVSEIIPLFFPIALIEGQGRILWDYNPFFRIFFDVALLILSFRVFYQKKKIIDTKSVPNYMYVFLFFHFCWFFIQIFNPNSLSPFAVIAASKIYIVPFIIFFSFLNNDEITNEKCLVDLRNIIIYSLLLEAALAIYQFNMGDQFIVDLYPYYKNIVKDVFRGLQYRAFGTSYLPGGYASYISLFLPLCFIKMPEKKFYKFLFVITILLCSYALFISQIRSLMLKTAAILGVITLGLFLRGEKKMKKAFTLSVGIVLIFFSLKLSGLGTFLEGDQFKFAIARLYSLTDSKTLTSSRGGMDEVLTKILNVLDRTPMGLGPGRTGAANSLFVDKIRNDPVYGLDASWAYDNLFVSLTIDLGIGMLFYTLFIFMVVFKQINMGLRAFFTNSPQFTVLLVTSTTTTIFLLGNWGALALPYNPDSFAFWFYSALGFKYGQYDRESKLL